MVLTLLPTDLGVLRGICRAVRCGARFALTRRGGCDLIGACARRHPSLSCPLARLVRAALLSIEEFRTAMTTMRTQRPTTQRQSQSCPLGWSAGSTPTKTPIPPRSLDGDGRMLGHRSSRRPAPATPCCWCGCAPGASWTRSGSRAPALTAPGWPAPAGRRVELVEVDRPDRTTRRGPASPTRSTPRPPPGPPGRPGRGVPEVPHGGSRPCGSCGWPAAAPHRPRR